MSRAWDKEKIWVPDRIWTYDLPNTGQVLYPLELRRTHGVRGHNTRFILILRCVLHTAWISNVKKKILLLWHNRPLALRGHVTNSCFKQWVGILLMPKIDGAHKNCLTLQIWEQTHLREILCVTLIFQESSMICIGCHVGGHTSCPPTWRPKLLFACILLNVW